MHTCALCQLPRQLLQSHIVPEFLYEQVYDTLHGYRVICTAPGARFARRRKGIYERLLCAECEGRLGRLEGYAARVFGGGLELELTDRHDSLVVGNLDYKTFKLFQMSVLWRCGVSRRREFRATDLGPHAERLRQMLLEERPGEPHDYGCVLILPASHAVTVQMIYPPEPVTCHGHRAYRASFGGLLWVYLVSSHSATFPNRDLFLNQGGTLRIVKEGLRTTEFLLKLRSELAGRVRE